MNRENSKQIKSASEGKNVRTSQTPSYTIQNYKQDITQLKDKYNPNVNILDYKWYLRILGFTPKGSSPLSFINICFICFKIGMMLFIIENIIIILSKYFSTSMKDLLNLNLDFNIDFWIDFKTLFVISINTILINTFFIKAHSFYIVLIIFIIIVCKNLFKHTIGLFGIRPNI